MSGIEPYDRGNYAPNTAAERSRADKRRSIIEAAEKRLSDLKDASPLATGGDGKKPDAAIATRGRRPRRMQRFY